MHNFILRDTNFHLFVETETNTVEDLNIGISDKKDNNNFLTDLCDTFSLQNIITGKTYHKCNVGISIAIMLTNTPRSFHKTSIFKTGISNIINWFFHFSVLISPEYHNIEYRKYKTFYKSKFLHDLDQDLPKDAIYQNNKEMYSIFARISQCVSN